MRGRRRIPALLPAVGILAAIVVAWEMVSRLTGVPAWLLPAPSRIAQAFAEAGPLLGRHVTRTLIETGLGFGLAFVGGIAVAVAIDQSSLVRRALYPLLVVSQTVPIFALAPLLAIWFGFGILPKVLIVALVCFFPIVVSTVDGLRSADREMLDLLRGMGASRAQVFRHVRLPAAIPALVAGTKIAVTYSVIGAVIAEWVGSSEGLGIFMLRSSSSFQTDRVFAVIAVIAVLSIGLFVTVSVLGRLVAPWTQTPEEHRP
ncbi:MAG: ABC transporter permease [Actinobacteria bacterium]|nr:ABC transporter permease [Actinomycetota bacterium]